MAANGDVQAEILNDEPAIVIPRLCQIFQAAGHMVGSAGSVSIRKDGNVYFCPSGVLKEYVKAEDLFVKDCDEDVYSPPPTKRLKITSNAMVVEMIFEKTAADTVIHTHCMSSNLLTQIIPGNEFRIRNQEMIKGISRSKSGGNYRNTDTLIVPIIENQPEEPDLQPGISKAIDDYPETCAVLVRNHGLFVWGITWKKTKIMYECYCYLFDLAIKMKQLGIELDR